MAVKLKIKKGDKVAITAGKDKGKRGEVVKVFPSDSKILVGGVNIVKKHIRPSKAYPSGGIVEKEMPIHISNVGIIDPKTSLPTRVGYKVLVDGKKVRVAKRSGEIIDNVN